MTRRAIQIPVGAALLEGDLVVPPGAVGLVVFAHGSGSGRNSPRNWFVAGQLGVAGFGTLLLDLLTVAEERLDAATRELRFDIELLSRRVVGAVRHVAAEPELSALPIGLFGSSTGAAAALVAAARLPQLVRAVVSRGGRPDLALPHLPAVHAPTLLIVGGEDPGILDLNEGAAAALGGPTRLVVVPGATHLFEEPGALEAVSGLAAEWFRAHLASDRPGDAPHAGV